MCTRVTCSTCGKPTFAGCGMHVEEVLAGVPRERRCRCREEREEKRRAAAAARRAAFEARRAADKLAWWERLLAK